MGLMLIFIIFWFIYLIFRIKSGFIDASDFILGALIFICSGLISLMLSEFLINIRPIHYETVDKHNLVAVADNYYASGIINSSGQLTYTVMTETESGYKAENIDASITTVLFGKEKPVLIEERSAFDSKFLNWFLFPGMNICYTMYIPEDSISMKFNIDLS